MVWRHEKLVQEDLNVGTGLVWITSPGSGELRSTQLGLHTFARGQQEYTKTWSPGAILTTANASTTITVPDAAVGDFVIASHDKLVTNALRISGHVSASGTVTVVIHNPTTATVTPASGTLSVLVFPVKTSSATPETIVEGTVTYDDGGGADPCVGLTVELRDGSDVVQATTTTNASGLYRFTNPTVTMANGEGFEIYVYAPVPSQGYVDTYDDSQLWAVETTMTVNIAMTGS